MATLFCESRQGLAVDYIIYVVFVIPFGVKYLSMTTVVEKDHPDRLLWPG